MNDLTIIVTTNPTSYATYVRSAIKMEAMAEAAKVRISLMTLRFEREMTAAARWARRNDTTGRGGKA